MDEKYQMVEAILNKIGKKVFVDFYYEFKNPDISTKELSEFIYINNPKSTSKGQGFRIPRARKIFENKLQYEALKIIIDSQRIDENTKSKANKILKEELRRQNIEKDIIEEKEFINEINISVLYSDQETYEYDNSRKKPKSKVTTEVYQRNRKVSENALLIADFMCEVSVDHELFKRKHRNINYTEPHHLIPLYAQGDFPDVDLDREQNIVSLCSNCHNHLHYGAEIDDLLRPLYEKRKELLSKIGVEITYEQLKAYYV